MEKNHAIERVLSLTKCDKTTLDRNVHRQSEQTTNLQRIKEKVNLDLCGQI